MYLTCICCLHLLLWLLPVKIVVVLLSSTYSVHSKPCWILVIPGTTVLIWTWNRYAKMRDVLNHTGRPVYFSLCGWEPW